MRITVTINTKHSSFHEEKDCQCSEGSRHAGCNFAMLSGVERLLSPMVSDIANGQTGRAFINSNGEVVGEWEATDDS